MEMGRSRRISTGDWVGTVVVVVNLVKIVTVLVFRDRTKRLGYVGGIDVEQISYASRYTPSRKQHSFRRF